ncbi:MAG: PKD domain-containing protein [Chloroflexota bacterium]|nr:PKD domain-containing protein [Chloroflexota bacterium]
MLGYMGHNVSEMVRRAQLAKLTRLLIALTVGALAALALLCWWDNPPALVTADSSSSQDCESYPIAVHADSVAGLQPGDNTGQIYQGTQASQFGWLLWNPDQNNTVYLEEELRDPSLSLNDYTNVMDASDHSLSGGDWVLGYTGVVNSLGLRSALDDLVASGATMRIIVWDTVAGSGGSTFYLVQRFVLARLTGYDLLGRWISLTYLAEAEDPELCRDFGLTLVADELRAGILGQSVYYTHVLTNQGNYTETAVLTYTTTPADWPISLNPVNVTLSPGQAVTITAIVTIPLDSAEGEVNVTHITASLIVSDAISAVVTDTTTVETPIAGLIATNDSPTPLGSVTALTATVVAGSNVTYTWAFGDGDEGSGSVVTHTYQAVGDCTAVVTASNGISVLAATTAVTVTEPGSIDPGFDTYLPLILRSYHSTPVP